MPELYRDYFDIDPEYFPVVNASVIAEHPDLWQKFYPHDSFVNLLERLVDAINRKHKLSVWVEGAYGTGKSHAVLTAKKLLDADNETVKQYFDKNPEKLSNDLYNRLCAVKSGAPILTVHRYGCDEINTEQDMLFAIQDSIAQAMQARGFEEGGEGALKNAALRWLSNKSNHDYFNSIMLYEFPDTFDNDNVDGLIRKLNTYSGVPLGELIGKMMKVGRAKRIDALSLSREDVIDWVKNIVKSNGLKAIVFFWDEFTEYFRNHANQLTTFQTLVEMSESSEAPLYLIPVTHDVASLFPPKDKEWTKISGRFYSPLCEITLPENIAFDLMGKAMQKKDDPVVRRNWAECAEELYDRTHDSRDRVKKVVGLTDQELEDVLPVHPYGALLLKQIATAFASDARSMFSFIKDDAGDEYRGFQWFIDNCGPMEDNPLLTIDMLWEFFYEKGKGLLASDVRRVLDAYGRAGNLIGDEPRVLKTVLLMQSIHDRAGNSGNAAKDGRELVSDLLAPTPKNLDYAFEGTDLEVGQAKKIADSLVRKNILYVKPGTDEYAVGESGSDEREIEERKDELKKALRTVDLVNETVLQGADNPFHLTGALAPRYELHYATADNFTVTLGQIKNQNMGVKIPAVLGFARDNLEAQKLSKLMAAEAQRLDNQIVLIDVTGIQFGDDRLEQYIDSKARQQYWLKKRGEQAAQYGKNVTEILKAWRIAMTKEELLVYVPDSNQPQRVSLPNLKPIYQAVARAKYPMGLETFARYATDTMWQSNSLKSGVGLGTNTTGKTLGAFSCAAKDLGSAWNEQGRDYAQKDPAAPISRIKAYVDGLISKAFETGDRISIREIYAALTEPPYGFMPVNQTAFMLGFLLRDYADGSYSCSDGIQASKLDVETLQTMVEGCMKNEMTPNPKYKDQYIVRMTREIKAFMEGSAVAFGTAIRQARLEDVRNSVVRTGMKRLPFPIRTLVYAMDIVPEEQREDVRSLVELYAALANDGGIGSRSPEDIAKDIGLLYLKDKSLAEQFRRLMTEDCSRKGMDNYLRTFEDGKLIALGQEISDGGQYINELKTRFRSDEFKWLWQQDTTDDQIRLVIRDYEIIAETNSVLKRHDSSLSECVSAWMSVCKNIPISCMNAKNYWQELKPLMDMLYTIKRANELAENRRDDFLTLVRNGGQAFYAFYTSGQLNIFKQSCYIDLNGLKDADIAAIYKKLIGTDCFCMDVQPYRNLVKTTVEKWRSEQVKLKLLDAWKTATKTETPRKWSDQNDMSILYMIPDGEEVEARSAFGTVNAAARGNVTEDAVKRALKYLDEHRALLDSLSDTNVCDEAFCRGVIGRNDVLLTVKQVKDYLVEKHLSGELTEDPYDWYKLGAVSRLVDELADYVYEGEGHERVSAIVDQMDAATAKRYLKTLIEKNRTVGVEILRDAQGK